MDRVAVFVDAGHLFAGGSAALSGTRKKRSELSLDVAKVVQYFSNKSSTLTNLPLLRIYWYDGALSNRLTTEQQQLAFSDHVKLRLGIVNSHGQQKGVDAKIITDLTELARNRAMSDVVLVGGDEDLRIGMELAQEYGVQVHLLHVAGSNVSFLLKREADTVSTITKEELALFLSIPPEPSSPPVILPAPEPEVRPAPALSPEPAPSAESVDYSRVVTGYLGQLPEPDKASLKDAIIAGNSIPREHDGKLLAQSRRAAGRDLTSQERSTLRKELKRHLGL